MWKILSSLFFVDQWCVGIVERPVSDFLQGRPSCPVHWLYPPSTNRFYADPFGRESDGELTILLEEFDYRSSIGRISSVGFNELGFSALDPVMVRPRHLSYPFLLTHDGQIYCVPEDKDSRKVSLYRATDYPSEWERVGTLIDDFAGVDSTIFRHDDRWWLTACDHHDCPHERLKVWHSAQLTGPWIPHKLPVVKADISSARPGGTPFWYDGSLYRPAQDCSRGYGGRIVINRIDRLTPTEFEEVPVSTVEPFPRPFQHGLHTLTAAGDRLTLVDGKKRVFIGARPSLWRHKLRRLPALSAAKRANR